ncbi:MAG: hypothetical protein F4Z35_02135 [Dehalococcoidia bacterium]|nr:hypothetical protein [Dehalococcoidia bacterium]
MGPQTLGLAPRHRRLSNIGVRQFHANTTLIFLGSCLLFAEGALGVIAAVTDVDPTLLAIFALIALGMVLTALVIMYMRDPAFLILSGQQAHDLRRLEILIRGTPDNLADLIVEDLKSTVAPPVIGTGIGSEDTLTPIDAEESELDTDSDSTG